MAHKKLYDNEFKIQAVKLGREVGFSKAAKKPGINVDMLYCKRAEKRLYYKQKDGWNCLIFLAYRCKNKEVDNVRRKHGI